MEALKNIQLVRTMLFITIIIGSVVLFNQPAMAQTNDKAAEEVMARAKAQWAMEIAGSTATDHLAEEYTQFSPGIPILLDGKEFITPFYEINISDGDKLVAANMANPKVQVYDNVAILSYNFIGTVISKDGTLKPRLSKSTRVYVKKSGQWMLVHANFGSVQ